MKCSLDYVVNNNNKKTATEKKLPKFPNSNVFNSFLYSVNNGMIGHNFVQLYRPTMMAICV